MQDRRTMMENLQANLKIAESSDPRHARIYQNLILLSSFLEKAANDCIFKDEHDALVILLAYLSSSSSLSLPSGPSHVLEPLMRLKQRLSKDNITPDQNDFNEAVNCGLLLLQENIINLESSINLMNRERFSFLAMLVQPGRLIPSYEANKIKQSYSWYLKLQRALARAKESVNYIKKIRPWMTGLCLIPGVFFFSTLFFIYQNVKKSNITISGGICGAILSLIISIIPILPAYLAYRGYNENEEQINAYIEKIEEKGCMKGCMIVTRTLSQQDYQGHRDFRKVLKQEHTALVKNYPSDIGGKPKKIVQNVVQNGEMRIELSMDSKQAQRFDTYEALRQARLPGSNQSQGSNQSLPDVTTFFSTLKQSKLESKMLKLALFDDMVGKHAGMTC